MFLSPTRRIGIATALLASSLAAGASTIDQSSPVGNAGFNANSPALEWQQQVVVGLAGQLTSVDLFGATDAFTVLQPFRFSINRGSGWQSDADDFSAVVTPLAGLFSIDLSSANLSFAVGESFSIGVQGLGPNNGCCALKGSGFTDGYAPGALYLSGSVYNGGSYDLAFNTHVGAVPEPASGALMAAGLLAMGWASRRRRTQG